MAMSRAARSAPSDAPHSVVAGASSDKQVQVESKIIFIKVEHLKPVAFKLGSSLHRPHHSFANVHAHICSVSVSLDASGRVGRTDMLRAEGRRHSAARTSPGCTGTSSKQAKGSS